MILRSGRVKPSFAPERRKRPGQVPMTTLGEIRFRGTGPLPAQYAKYEFDISRPSEPFYSSDAERLGAMVADPDELMGYLSLMDIEPAEFGYDMGVVALARANLNRVILGRGGHDAPFAYTSTEFCGLGSRPGKYRGGM